MMIPNHWLSWRLSTSPGSKSRRRLPRPRRRSVYRRPLVGLLEDRTLLSGGSISGRVWDDSNANGIHDPGELGLAGRTVFLDLHQDGTLDPGDPWTVTNSNGDYQFTGLAPGTYTVNQLQPAGWRQTGGGSIQGVLNATFSDGADGFTSTNTAGQWQLSGAMNGDPGHSSGGSFYFAPGQEVAAGTQLIADGTLTSPTIDLTHVRGPITLQFNEWYQGQAQLDYAGVSVLAGGTETLVTATHGDMNLPDQTNGFMPVSLDLSNFAGQQIQLEFRLSSRGGIIGFTSTNVTYLTQLPNRMTDFGGWYLDDVRVTGQSDRVSATVGPGETVGGQDFADQQLGQVQGSVWTDLNGDGRLARDEPALAGATVYLDLDGNGRWNQGEPEAVTDANGRYQFTGLAPGNDTVAVLPPSNFVGRVEVSSYTVTVAEGQTVKAPHFGLQPLPDLEATSFQLGETTAVWGDTTTVSYTIANHGQAAAGSFDVEVRVLTDSVIDAGDPLLETFAVPGLAAGAETSGTLTVTLPGSAAVPPPSFTAPSQVFVGLRIDPAGAIPEANGGPSGNHQAGADYAPLALLTSQTEVGPNHTMATAMPVPANSRTGGVLTPGIPEFFQVAVDVSGRLTARVHTDGFAARLSLYGADGTLLLQSDGQLTENGDALIDQHVDGSSPGTTYWLEVDAPAMANPIAAGGGHYTLAVQFQGATAPFQPFGMDLTALANAPVVGDFNGDGIPDLVVIADDGVVANDGVDWQVVGLRLGLGDGTFGPAQSIIAQMGELNNVIEHNPVTIAAADFNGDGHLDLVETTDGTSLTVILGRGDGTFLPPQSVDTGSLPAFVAVGDFNEDGVMDLAVANKESGDLSILLGRGDGTFQPQVRYSVPWGSGYVRSGDFNGDGHLDLVLDSGPGIVLLPGRGDGTFGAPVWTWSKTFLFSDVAGDFNGDGRLDLAATDGASVYFLEGNGDGTFSPEIRVGTQTDTLIDELTVGDFNGHGHLDLVGPDLVLLGKGDGTFTTFADHSGVVPGTAADLNGDGHLDLVAVSSSTTVTIDWGVGDGGFQSLAATTSLFYGAFIATGDFNGDGIPDVAQSVIMAGGYGLVMELGRGDGTFQDLAPSPLAGVPYVWATGDFNGDGKLDLVSASAVYANTVCVYFGNGDGTFQPAVILNTASNPRYVTVGDFNGDGLPDLAVLDDNSQQISVFLSRRDGTFSDPINSPALGAYTIEAGDFNGDGKVDLAAVSGPNQFVNILLGQGDGTFQLSDHVSTADYVTAIVLDDFNHDGRLDLATAYGSGVGQDVEALQVYLGRGDGTLGPGVIYPMTGTAYFRNDLAVGDLNGDGNPDVVVTHDLTNAVSIFYGRGDGTFQSESLVAVGNAPRNSVITDLNHDGRLDLVVSNGYTGGVSVLLQGADGALLNPVQSDVVNPSTRSLAVADFNQDGQLDVVAAHAFTNDAAVLLGQGDGSVRNAQPLGLGTHPISVVAADFNGDGRPDFASVNDGSNDLTVALGLGDGTFQTPVSYPLGGRPTYLVVGDWNGDGRVDLAVADTSDQVLILLGRGNGTFESPIHLAVGSDPTFLLATDFNHDGKPDLLAVNYLSDDISLLFGNGDGTFRPQICLPAGIAPTSVAAGDFNHDGVTDYAVSNYTTSEVSVYFRDHDGTVRAPVHLAVGAQPRSLVAADFSDDGILDLAVAKSSENDISILIGNPDGTFQREVRYPVGTNPYMLAAADFNNDGRLDLVTANQLGQNTTILMGLGDGTFVNPATLVTTIHATPVVADFNRDGALDVATINASGQILLRLGRPGDAGSFQPAVVLNPDPQDAARDLAVVNTPAGPILAALDARDSGVTLYGVRSPVPVVMGLPSAEPATTNPGDPLVRIGGFAVPGTLAVRLVSGDLNGDGRDDLVVVTAGSHQVFVSLQNPAGAGNLFSSKPSFHASVGISPVGLALVDVNGDGRPDIVVSNQFNGDLSVLLNSPVAPFSTEQRFAAGATIRYLADANGSVVDHSGDGPAGLVAGPPAASGTGSVIVADSADNSITVLQGTATGGLLNPQAATTYANGAGSQPTVVAAGQFTADGNLDLAVLNEGTSAITIFLGNGHGGFTQGETLNAGNQPTGLSVDDINGDGHQDLLVGDPFGDVLVLLGNGNGTFRPYQRADQSVALAVADLTGNGKPDFIFADQGLDQVTVQYGNGGQTFSQDRKDGILAPGAVSVADSERRWHPRPDRGQQRRQRRPGLPRPRQRAVRPRAHVLRRHQPGRHHRQRLEWRRDPGPVRGQPGLQRPITVSWARARAPFWTMTAGPRLQADGTAPVATTVADVTGPHGVPDGIPDLLVTDSQSNRVAVLPGVGSGFFNDQNPQTFGTGIDPIQSFVGTFGGGSGLDLVTINAGSNDLTFFPGFGAGQSIASGGVTPVAGVVLSGARLLTAQATWSWPTTVTAPFPCSSVARRG